MRLLPDIRKNNKSIAIGTGRYSASTLYWRWHNHTNCYWCL